MRSGESSTRRECLFFNYNLLGDFEEVVKYAEGGVGANVRKKRVMGAANASSRKKKQSRWRYPGSTSLELG